MMRPKFGKALPVATSQRLAFGHLIQPRPVVDPSPDSAPLQIKVAPVGPAPSCVDSKTQANGQTKEQSQETGAYGQSVACRIRHRINDGLHIEPYGRVGADSE